MLATNTCIRSRSGSEGEREPCGNQREATDRSKTTQTLVACEHVIVARAAEQHRSRQEHAADL